MKKQFFYSTIVILVAAILISTGCIPVYNLNSSLLDKPISMTNKQISHNYEVIEHFRKHIPRHMLLGIIPINSSPSLSNTLSSIIYNSGGDGISNIKFNTYLNPFEKIINLFSLGFIIPAPLEVEGDVIKYIKNK
jgi:hypothetical protein